MLRVALFAAGIIGIAASALLFNTGTPSGQAMAGASENCKIIQIQPDAAYGNHSVRQLRICQ